MAEVKHITHTELKTAILGALIMPSVKAASLGELTRTLLVLGYWISKVRVKAAIDELVTEGHLQAYPEMFWRDGRNVQGVAYGKPMVPPIVPPNPWAS